MKIKPLVSFGIVLLILIAFLFGCNKEEDTIYWTEKTDSQIERLDRANVKYEIREGEIWVREKDMETVIACCT